MIRDNIIESYIKEKNIKVYDITALNLHSIFLENENDFIELTHEYNPKFMYRKYIEETTTYKPEVEVDFEEIQQLLEDKFKYLEAVSDILSEDEYITKLDSIIKNNMHKYNESTTFTERWLQYSFTFSESCCYEYEYHETEGEKAEEISKWEIITDIISDSEKEIKAWGIEIGNCIKNEYKVFNEQLLRDEEFFKCKNRDSRILRYDEIIDKQFPYLAMLKNKPNMLRKLPNFYFSFDKKTRSSYAERIYTNKISPLEDLDSHNSNVYIAWDSSSSSPKYKIGFVYSTPLPLNHEGWRFYFLLLLFYNYLMCNILQEIFRDNHAEFMIDTHPRKAVIENVDKMIDCGNPSFSGAMYGCTKCGTL